MKSTHKYITLYWTDGLPSNGLGMNKGRKTALGYFIGKQCVMSLPARLNNHDMPTWKEIAAILAGDSVAEAMTEFNRATVRAVADKMNADCLDFAALPGNDDFMLAAFDSGIYLVASDLDGGTLDEAAKHERVAGSWMQSAVSLVDLAALAPPQSNAQVMARTTAQRRHAV